MNHQYRRKCIIWKGETCKICGEEDDVDVHHLNGDRENNSIENLVPICRYCHVGIHEARENYRHWTDKLLPWYSKSEQEPDVNTSGIKEDLSTHKLADNLIFLEEFASSTATDLARLEYGNKPFQCPRCGAEQTLGSEYSLDNHKPCPECDWFGGVHEGVVEAANQRSVSDTESLTCEIE